MVWVDPMLLVPSSLPQKVFLCSLHLSPKVFGELLKTSSECLLPLEFGPTLLHIKHFCFNLYIVLY